MPLRFRDETTADNFGVTPPFQVGVEEELFLVDAHTLELERCTDAVLARQPRFSRGLVLGEMCDGVIELASPVSPSARVARDHLAALRGRVGHTVLGAGVHPTAAFGDVRHRGGLHYEEVSATTRCLLRQTPFCGAHVHVGMPDPETAIVAYNGLRRWVPLLQALSANSPFWYGTHSGMASARSILAHSLPRSGFPRAFDGWRDYDETMRELLRVGELDGLGSIWWDIRPHPQLGTVEVRALDAQSSLDDLAGLVALVHCLALHEAVTPGTPLPRQETLQEASFRAVRDGIDATFSLGGPIRHVSEHAREALDVAAGYAARLDCAGELRQVERMLAEGNGAARQQRAYAEGGMPALLRHLADESRPAPAAPAVEAA